MTIFYGECVPKSGYFKPTTGPNTGGLVEKCDDNCRECIETAIKCTSCHEH